MAIEKAKATQVTPSMGPMAQFQQLASACSLFFSTTTEKTNEAFEKVVVSKKDARGQVITYVDAETKKNITQVHYILEKKTGDLYFNDAPHEVAGKCGLVVLALPIYTFGAIAWHLGKIPFEVTSIALNTWKQSTEKLQEAKVLESAWELLRGCSQVSGRVGSAIFEAIKAPLFGFCTELSAIYGLFKPYHARKIEALMENACQNGASYREDFREIPARKGESCLQAFFTDIQERRPFYLAHCFQIRGNINERRITVVKRAPLESSYF